MNRMNRLMDLLFKKVKRSVGNGETERPYRYDYLGGNSEKMKHESGIGLKASFEM